MCWFISVVIPQEMEFALAKQIAQDYGFHWNFVKNTSLETQLPENALYYRATDYCCDCDTGLGIKNREGDNLEENFFFDLTEDTLKELKLEKEVSQKAELMDLENWFLFIKHFLEQAGGYLGILLHDYRSTLEEEKIVIKRKTALELKNLSLEILARLEDDVLYILTKNSSRYCVE